MGSIFQQYRVSLDFDFAGSVTTSMDSAAYLCEMANADIARLIERCYVPAIRIHWFFVSCHRLREKSSRCIHGDIASH
jgi:hypothetical protein